MFLITASTVVNASAAWDANEPFSSVEIEGKHTAHHLHSVDTFLAFIEPKMISQLDRDKHVNTQGNEISV